MAILDLATYKTYKSINSTNKDDVLNVIIPSVNNYITSYCNRQFSDAVSPITEYFDINTTEYYPKEFPLVSVTSLEYSSDSDGVYDTALVEYTDYIIDINNDKIVSRSSNFANTTIGVASGKLVYTAGYVTVPEDIEQAAVLLTEYYLEESYTPKKSMAGTTKENIIIMDTTARLPAHIRRILEHYRNWTG